MKNCSMWEAQFIRTMFFFFVLRIVLHFGPLTYFFFFELLLLVWYMISLGNLFFIPVYMDLEEPGKYFVSCLILNLTKQNSISFLLNNYSFKDQIWSLKKCSIPFFAKISNLHGQGKKLGLFFNFSPSTFSFFNLIPWHWLYLRFDLVVCFCFLRKILYAWLMLSFVK